MCLPCCHQQLFCHLAEGDNTLRFSAFIGDEVLTASLCVTYATHTDAPLYSFPQLLHEQNPSVTRRMTCASESAVRFIYALGSDGDGTMQAPDEGTLRLIVRDKGTLRVDSG